LPCLLVENKVDLVDNPEGDDPSLQEFAQKNEFCGCFRTSAKAGINISESMEFLIKTIIKRMEDMQSKGNEVFSVERKNVELDPEKHTQAATTNKRKKDGGCC
jgi:50S ribosomal subunit-associated GTPase HflX